MVFKLCEIIFYNADFSKLTILTSSFISKNVLALSANSFGAFETLNSILGLVLSGVAIVFFTIFEMQIAGLK